MDDTASFSSRSNAKRAAEKMIANGHGAGGRLRLQAARRRPVPDRLEDG